MSLERHTVETARHHDFCDCDPDTLDTPWKADLCAILHTEEPACARQLLDMFLSDERASIARVLTRVRRVARLDTDEDGTALSYFGQALLRMLNKRWRAKTGPGASRVFSYARNLPVILEAETRNCLREDRREGLLNDSAGAPGASAHHRRSSLVKRSRQLFELEHQHTPTDDELVSFHNERMRATRKDAARQSVLISNDDLRPVTVVRLDDPGLASDTRLSVRDEPDLGAHERSRKIAGIIARCEVQDRKREKERTRRLRRKSVQTADVARAYFAHHIDGDFPSRREIIDQLNITEPAAQRELTARLETVLGIAREAFIDDRHSPWSCLPAPCEHDDR